jgi:hypothetical protein
MAQPATATCDALVQIRGNAVNVQSLLGIRNDLNADSWNEVFRRLSHIEHLADDLLKNPATATHDPNDVAMLVDAAEAVLARINWPHPDDRKLVTRLRCCLKPFQPDPETELLEAMRQAWCTSKADTAHGTMRDVLNVVRERGLPQ